MRSVAYWWQMVHSISKSPRLRLCVALASFAALGWLSSGCHRDERPDLTPELERLKAELGESAKKVADLEARLSKRHDELALSNEAALGAKTEAAERDEVVNQQQARVSALQSQIDALKKRDAFVFAEIAGLQQRNQYATSTSLYQKFIRDYPSSPLAANAASAIAEMSAKTERDTRDHLELFEPGSRERQFRQTFDEGYMTLRELAPYLKNKKLPQVLQLLGPANASYNNGSELGYADRAVSPTTGKKGMLIISFDAGIVSSLRVDYAGQQLFP